MAVAIMVAAVALNYVLTVGLVFGLREPGPRRLAAWLLLLAGFLARLALALSPVPQGPPSAAALCSISAATLWSPAAFCSAPSRNG